MAMIVAAMRHAAHVNSIARFQKHPKDQEGKNLSQEEVAQCADIHQTYLSGVETGKRNPSILVVERIAKAFPVDVSEIFKLN